MQDCLILAKADIIMPRSIPRLTKLEYLLSAYYQCVKLVCAMQNNSMWRCLKKDRKILREEVEGLTLFFSAMWWSLWIYLKTTVCKACKSLCKCEALFVSTPRRQLEERQSIPRDIHWHIYIENLCQARLAFEKMCVCGTGGSHTLTK